MLHMPVANCKLQIEKCKLQIDRARVDGGFLFAIANLQSSSLSGCSARRHHRSEDLGAQGTSAAPALAEAERYCRDLATSHYENFTVVSWFLPRELRQPMSNVYAFCRWADDLGDETGDRARSTELLAWWRSELQRCFAGEATHPCSWHSDRRFGISTFRSNPLMI